MECSALVYLGVPHIPYLYFAATACAELTILQGDSGYIGSPIADYPGQVTCRWTFVGVRGSSIQLGFVGDRSLFAEDDYLNIRANGSTSPLYSITGSDGHTPLVLSDTATVELVTTSSTSTARFNMSWSIVDSLFLLS